MYQSLYRKYRPMTFDRIVGQKSIITILKNSISRNMISHAYLFSGPRGTGKTSTAKILAKTINCLNSKNGISCENCENCDEVNSGSVVDIIEIDAASNNGVDEIRELRNNINLACSSLKYKVYIIDEVHMLSIGAFNALLKTLEEPPLHVIFILATTDPQKVPTTILSRCQCYQFSQISIQDIVENLKYICKSEGIAVSEEILEKIAIISNGGMRDAIGLLEKVNLYGSNISLDEFHSLCGFVTSEDINDIIDAIFNLDIERSINIITNKYNEGINLNTFFSQCIDTLRSIAINNISDEAKLRRYTDIILLLNNLCNEIKTSINTHGIAIAVISEFILEKNEKKVNTPEKNNDKVVDKKENQEKSKKEEIKKLDTNVSTVETNAFISEKNSDFEEENNLIIINNTFATATKQNLLEMQKKWELLNDYILDSNYGSNVSFLLDGKLRAVGDKYFIFSFQYPSLVKRAKEMQNDLINTLTNILNINYNIAFLTDDDWEEEKKKYINKKKKGESYNILSVKKENNKKEKIKSDADSIFGEDIVEYE